MSQRKKKHNNKQVQIHLAREYRANFFRRMKYIIDNQCGPDIYPLIPQNILDEVYQCRCAPFKIIADHKSYIPTKFLKEAKIILPSLIKSQPVTIPDGNLEITLNEFYTVYFSIHVLKTKISDASFANAGKVKEALRIIVNNTAIKEAASMLMYIILNTYNFGESDLRKMVHWLKYEMRVPKTFPAETENIITIYSVIPENITIKVDGIVRPAIRLGWVIANSGADWISLKPSDLGIDSPFAEVPLKVYIQTHAINRLLERIDCFWTGNIQFYMYLSFSKPVIAHDNNNNLLIEFRIFDIKAGYFRADIVDGIVLIRTFLFITNNGTPEGQLLEKNTGLQKLDKKYLAIDKLSTFMTSDLDKNPEVQRIFKTSGCQCLLDLYEQIKPMVTKHANGFNSELMLKYITNQNIGYEKSYNETPLLNEIGINADNTIGFENGET